jgi:hypothetical protein
VSAAERVAQAAKTIRARWEQQVSTDPQTEAAQALEDAGQLLDPEAAAELVAFRKARELAAVVAEHGALPMPVGPELQGVDIEDQREQAEAWEGHILGAWDGKFAMEGGLDRAVLKLARMVKSDVAEVDRLRAQVAELNESLTVAAEALRARQSCPCPSVDQPGPHQVGCPQAEVPGRSVEVSADRLSRFFAPVASLREDPHDSPLHHSYRVPRDLPEMGGA